MTPMKTAGQYGAGGPDPERAAFDVQGKIIVSRGEIQSLSGGTSIVVPDGSALAFVDLVAWPAIINLVKGDQIASDDHAGFLFEVASSDRPLGGRLPLILKVLKSP